MLVGMIICKLHDCSICCSDDEEDEIAQFPIVKESAGKLLESGINTLQKTLLLKKEVEVERVDNDLQDKRDEFRDRMETCAQRQVDIQKKQQRVCTYSTDKPKGGSPIQNCLLC